MLISFSFLDTHIALAERKRLKAFIADIFKRNKKELHNLSYVFCTDEYLLGVNQRFLSHDYYTDIITFDLSESAAVVIGETYISVDRVRENAKLIGVSVKEELHRVIFHGALHLCGFNDQTEKDKAGMRLEENINIVRYFK